MFPRESENYINFGEILGLLVKYFAPTMDAANARDVNFFSANSINSIFFGRPSLKPYLLASFLFKFPLPSIS